MEMEHSFYLVKQQWLSVMVGEYYNYITLRLHSRYFCLMFSQCTSRGLLVCTLIACEGNVYILNS